MTVRALNLREVRRVVLASDYDDRIAQVCAVAARHNLVQKQTLKVHSFVTSYS